MLIPFCSRNLQLLIYSKFCSHFGNSTQPGTTLWLSVDILRPLENFTYIYFCQRSNKTLQLCQQIYIGNCKNKFFGQYWHIMHHAITLCMHSLKLVIYLNIIICMEWTPLLLCFRIAIFSVNVLKDDRIVVVAEQRPQCTEEEVSYEVATWLAS